MSTPTTPITYDIPGFIMTEYIGKTLWGQILKDVDYYEPSEAATFVWVLGKLGYEPAFDFMAHEYHRLVSLAKQSRAADTGDNR